MSSKYLRKSTDGIQGKYRRQIGILKHRRHMQKQSTMHINWLQLQYIDNDNHPSHRSTCVSQHPVKDSVIAKFYCLHALADDNQRIQGEDARALLNGVTCTVSVPGYGTCIKYEIESIKLHTLSCKTLVLLNIILQI